MMTLNINNNYHTRVEVHNILTNINIILMIYLYSASIVMATYWYLLYVLICHIFVYLFKLYHSIVFACFCFALSKYGCRYSRIILWVCCMGCGCNCFYWRPNWPFIYVLVYKCIVWVLFMNIVHISIFYELILKYSSFIYDI